MLISLHPVSFETFSDRVSWKR